MEVRANMYLLEFLLRKTIRTSIPILFWAAAILIPVVLAQVGVFDFAIIEGRCYRPILKCGQDNVFQVAFGVAILGSVVAASVTWVSVFWDDDSWKQEREKLRTKHHPIPEREPVKPDIYN